MKYAYSILFLLVVFFGLPPVLDLSGNLVDHVKQSFVSTEDNSTSLNIEKVRNAESRTEKSITTPTTTKIARE